MFSVTGNRAHLAPQLNARRILTTEVVVGFKAFALGSHRPFRTTATAATYAHAATSLTSSYPPPWQVGLRWRIAEQLKQDVIGSCSEDITQLLNEALMPN